MLCIIGGSGFIGSALAGRFHDKCVEFKVLDIRGTIDGSQISTRINVDVRDKVRLIEVTKGEAIVNLAAEHRDDVEPISLYDDVNVGGALNVCEAAEANGIQKIVFTSTVAVYGFAPLGTDESGEFAPFNDYGRTKLEAEQVYKDWQAKDPYNRSLVIIRPTVVFGEGNRGNVYNLLRQIASGRFRMIGSGTNVKSMAYVGNVVAFIEHSLGFGPGVHIYNYVDKPDFNMNTLVETVYRVLVKKAPRSRLPYAIGIFVGSCFDLAAKLTGKKFSISAIRVKKFCSDTMFNTSVDTTGFKPPVPITEALERTIRYEFVNDNSDKQVYFTE